MTCCPLADALSSEALRALDAELRRPGHPGFKALAKRFGATRKDVEHHKRRCLAPPPDEGRVPRVGPRYPGPAPTRASAHARDPADALDFDARVAFVLGEMAAGTFDGPRHVPDLARTWQLSEDHTRRIARAAGAAYRASATDMDIARAASLGRWRALYDAAVLAGDIRGAAAALAGHDRVAGLGHDRPDPVPLTERPDFTEAVNRYLDAVYNAMDPFILAAHLPDVDFAVLQRVARAVEDAVHANVANVAKQPEEGTLCEMN